MDRKTFSASIRAAAAKLSASDGTMDNVMEKLEDAHAALDDAAVALTFIKPVDKQLVRQVGGLRDSVGRITKDILGR